MEVVGEKAAGLKRNNKILITGLEFQFKVRFQLRNALHRQNNVSPLGMEGL